MSDTIVSIKLQHRERSPEAKHLKKMKWLLQYFHKIKLDKTILWCYLIWYFVVVWFHFDPELKIWINAIGISLVIGTGLLLSVSSGGDRDPWQTFRLYLMPFCVSSFSTLIKDQGFLVVIPPNIQETLVALVCCVAFLSIVFVIKFTNKKIAWYCLVESKESNHQARSLPLRNQVLN